MHFNRGSVYQADGHGMNCFEKRKVVLVLSVLCLFLTSHFSLAFGVEFRYDSHGKRDPFLSPASAGSQMGSGELRLEGVVVDQSGGSYAIVNSQIVKEGESLQGFLLKKIESNRVLFEKEGEDFEIILRQDEELLKQYLQTPEKNSGPFIENELPAESSDQKEAEPA